MRKFAVAAALLTLAACGGQDEGEGNGTGNLAAGTAYAPKSDMKLKPGQWETVVEVEGLENLPRETAEALGKTVTSHCMTPEQSERHSARMFMGKTGDNCRAEGFSAVGGRFQGTMICSGGEMPGTTMVEMDGRYSDQEYVFTQKTTTSGEGVNAVMHSKITGRRTGECTGKETGTETGNEEA